MKRRDFLKKLGIVCGAAVAYPAALLKGKTKPKYGWHEVKFEKGWRKHLWIRGKDGSLIIGEKTRWLKYHASNRFTIAQQNQLAIEFEKEFWTQSKNGDKFGIDWFIGKQNETTET